MQDCVEINLGKELPDKVMIQDYEGNVFWQKVDYEWIPNTCTKCHRYDHKESNCELKNLRPEVKKQEGKQKESHVSDAFDNKLVDEVDKGDQHKFDSNQITSPKALQLDKLPELIDKGKRKDTNSMIAIVQNSEEGTMIECRTIATTKGIEIDSKNDFDILNTINHDEQEVPRKRIDEGGNQIQVSSISSTNKNSKLSKMEDIDSASAEIEMQDSAASAEIVTKSSALIDIENPYNALVSHIAGMLEGVESTPSMEHCIDRVPMEVRKIDEEAYTPQVVSTVPFHHGNERLQSMEPPKLIYFKKLIERGNMRSEDYVGLIKQQEEKICHCYAETIALNSDKFLTMILVDAGFIIELLLRSYFGDLREQNEPLLSKPWLIIDIEHDLILLRKSASLLCS
ncbi:hypothetical protein F0562_007252 [Nyssa sinensis]|uniref:DUF4283 domain-containing protein n=1 Tax=Nyssa sinensis TaxID=561372 RepID=A0A5J5A7R2_9ASTE|nr:hypothetical protein F0562_007252 [Nyssa sinensis]